MAWDEDRKMTPDGYLHPHSPKEHHCSWKTVAASQNSSQTSFLLIVCLKGERQEMRQTASGSQGGGETWGFHIKSLTDYLCSRKIQGSLDSAQSKTDSLQWIQVLYEFALFLYFPITSHLSWAPFSLGEIADQAPLQVLQVWRDLPGACRPLMSELVYILCRNLGWNLNTWDLKQIFIVF